MKTTIGNFFNFISQKEINLSENKVSVETREGYHRIKAVDVTEKDAKPYYLELENGYMLICSKDHKVRTYTGKYKEVRNLKIGERISTKQGNVSVKTITKLKGRIDLLDLEVDELNEYYTNGICSHNSTILDCIKLGLYGKTTNKNLKNIANRRNKNGEIGINFMVNDKLVNIERTYGTSNKLNVIVNGNTYDVSGKKDVQKYVETELLDFSYYVFSNLVSLSIRDFKSFLSMSPADKRLIIDKVFSLSVINDMREELKKIIKDVDKEMNDYKIRTSHINATIETYKSKIEELKKILETNNKLEIENLEKKVSEANLVYVELNDKINQLKEKKNSAEKKDSEIYENVINLKSVIKAKQKELSLYESNKCGTCGSDLTTAYHMEIKKNIEVEMESHIKSIEEYEAKRLKAKDYITNVKTKLDSYKRDMEEISYEMRNSNSKIKELYSKLKSDTDIDGLESLLESQIKTKEEAETNQAKVEKKVKFYGIVDKMLSDKGIKQLAIANIVPSINNTINETLYEFETSFNVEFDQDFNSKVFNRGADIEVSELSSGEQTILDFAVLVTMIKLLKTKYFDLNIIFLDEIFGTLDMDNVYNVLNVLKKLCYDLKLNVYVIHHSILDLSNFDSVIKVEKEDGVFSNLKIEKKE